MPAIVLVIFQTWLYQFVAGEAAPLRMKKIVRKPSGASFASFSVAVTPLSAPNTTVGEATARVRMVPSLLIVNARDVLLAADVGSPAKLALSE